MISRRRQQEELETDLADAVGELAGAAQRLDLGETGAARTIAANLRLLLGPRRGDHLLWRVAKAKGADIAPVWQSPPLQTSRAAALTTGELTDQVEIVAFGPSFYHSAQDAPPGAVEAPLHEALEGRCFMVRNPDTGEAEKLTWLEALVTVADKVAVHADEEIPRILDQLDRLVLQSGRAAGFEQVLRKLATVVIPRAQDVLGSPTTA
jgi:hypothetical protein